MAGEHRARAARRGRGRWRWLALALVTVATAVPVVHEASAGSLVGAASGEFDYYCSLYEYLEEVSNTPPDFEQHTNQEQFRIARGIARDALPLVDAIRNSAPKAVHPDMDVVVGAVRQVARDGDFRLLGLRGGESLQAETHLSPRAVAIRQALARLHRYNVGHCGWRPQPITADDFSYPGAPAGVRAGLTSFEFANRGREIHQMILVRERKGATESLRAILDRYSLARNPDRLILRSKELTNVGMAFSPPNKSDYLVAKLQPGQYAMVCFIPRGSIFISELDESLGTGPNHYRLGMASFFTVRG